MGEARLGRYRLGRRIAAGGMAEVFEATVEGAAGFEKQVAIKRILPHLADDPEFVSMFQDEARLASRLTHANIAQVFDFGEADGVLYLVMEWVNGRDLRRVIQAGRAQGLPLTPARAAQIAREVARALAYAHALKGMDGAPLDLVHRDVSPQNILVSFSGEVKLTDFGIAKAARGRVQTAQGILKGKTGYMSPEQVRGERLDGRSDVFCLGVVLWESLTGRALFEGGSDLEILRMVERLDPPAPSTIRPQVPARLDEVVLRALAKDPGDRFPGAAELEVALGDVLLGHAQSTRELELGSYVRALFPEEAEGRPPSTRRFPDPGPPPPPAVAETQPDRPARPSPESGRSAPTRELSAETRGGRRVLPWVLSAGLVVAAVLWTGSGPLRSMLEGPAPAPLATEPPEATAAPAEIPVEAPGLEEAEIPAVAPDLAKAEATVEGDDPGKAKAPAQAITARRPPRRSPPRQTPRETEAAPGGAQVLRRSEESQASGAHPERRVPKGTRLGLRLQRGLDTAGQSEARAFLVRSFTTPQRVLLPRGAVFTGRASAQGDRVLVRFTEVHTGEWKTAVDAFAVDAQGRPGLAPPGVVLSAAGAPLSLPPGFELIIELAADATLP